MVFDSINYTDMILITILFTILILTYIQLQIAIEQYSNSTYILEVSTINYKECLQNSKPSSIVNTTTIICPLVKVSSEGLDIIINKW